MLDILITIFTLCSTLQACFYSCFGEPLNRSAIIFDYFMEAFFLIDILKTFFLQYQDDEDRKPVRDMRLIAIRYLKGRFFIEVIAISTIPLKEFFRGKITDDKLSLLYLLRLLRLVRAITVIDTQRFQVLIKAIYRRQLNQSIKNNQGN